MKDSYKIGIDFSLTSAVITTLGLMVGLNASTQSTIIIIGGILTIAIADSMSDALGIHISQEASKKKTHRDAWESTIATFMGKFFLSLFFIIPIIFLELNTAIILNVMIGLGIISLISYKIAIEKKESVFQKIFEHLIITIMVIVFTQITGSMIRAFLI